MEIDGESGNQRPFFLIYLAPIGVGDSLAGSYLRQSKILFGTGWEVKGAGVKSSIMTTMIESYGGVKR